MNKTQQFLLTILIAIISNVSSAALIKDQVLTVDGMERTYDLFVPSNDSTRNGVGVRPLVLLLHGDFGSVDVMTGQNARKHLTKPGYLLLNERAGVWPFQMVSMVPMITEAGMTVVKMLLPTPNLMM